MTIALALILVGICQTLVGWLFFRNPGVNFWTFGPVWRANQFLNSVGVSLWVGGSVTSFVGIAILLSSHFV